MTQRRQVCALLAGGLAFGTAAHGQGTEFPNKTVKIIVPYAAGSATDALARLLGENLSAKWRQPVVVESRPGAGGSMGAEMVYNAPADGTTLLFMPGPFVHKSLYTDLRYDPEKLVALSAAATGYSVLVVHPSVRAQTLQELIAYAKANPGKLNYASQGIGSVAHLAGEMFKRMAGVNVVHVGYKGNSPAMTDLLAGQVDLMFLNFGSALPYVRSGKLRALALGSERRTAVMPDLPTVAESVPGFLSMVWWGLFAPPGTPKPIADMISLAVHEALRTPELTKWIVTNTFEAVGGTPADTVQLLRRDNDRWNKVIKEAGIKPE